MSEENANLIDAASHLNLDLLQALQEKPEPFTPGASSSGTTRTSQRRC